MTSNQDTHITLTNLSTTITSPKPSKSADPTDEALIEEIIALLKSKETEIHYTQLLEIKDTLLKSKPIPHSKISPNNQRLEVEYIKY